MIDELNNMPTLREIVMNQINHIETEFVPYTLALDDNSKMRLNEHFGGDSWEKNLLPCIKAIGDTFDSWCTMKVLDPAEPHIQMDAFGNIWDHSGAIAHVKHPAMENIALQDYKWPTLEDFLTKEKKEYMEKMAKSHPNQYRVAEAGPGHYEWSWRMLGTENALIMSIAEPDEYEEIIDKLDMLINQFVDECIKLPVDAIMLFDDWCDQRTCIMGPDRWRYYIKPRLAKIYDKIHRSGKKVVNHVCGSVECLIPDLIEIGLDVLETVQPEAANMNPYMLKQKYGKDLTFWGALGCQYMTTYGTPKEIQNEIRRLRKEMSVGGGYILAPCKDVNWTVPMENLLMIYETFIEENYKYRAD